MNLFNIDSISPDGFLCQFLHSFLSVEELKGIM